MHNRVCKHPKCKLNFACPRLRHWQQFRPTGVTVREFAVPHGASMTPGTAAGTLWQPHVLVQGSCLSNNFASSGYRSEVAVPLLSNTTLHRQRHCAHVAHLALFLSPGSQVTLHVSERPATTKASHRSVSSATSCWRCPPAVTTPIR